MNERPDGEEELLPEEEVQVEEESFDEPPPEEPPVPLSETIKQAFKDALYESRNLLADIFAEGIRRSQYREPEPQIEYNERQHWLKFALSLSAIIGITMLTLAVFTLGLAVMNQAIWLILVYPVALLITLYLSAREWYKWRELRIYREGSTLHAIRPERNRLLLTPINSIIPLKRVNTAIVKTGLIESIIGIGRIEVDVPGHADEKFWNNLAFVIDADRLIKSINQGKNE